MGDVLRSPLLERHGFRHAFNLRSGGVSAEPFSSFNLGRAVGDDAESVLENHKRFAAAVGYPDGALYEVSQVHGCELRVADGEVAPQELRQREADALLAPPGGRAIGVRVADCVPVLVGDPESGTVAAVHAGWRGTVRGVLEQAGAQLEERGIGTGALQAAIFPHIRSCCFEVGEDVAAELHAAAPEADAVDRDRDKPHVNLTAVVVAKLQRLGLASSQIDDVAGCTRCEPERFYSYRREGKRSGRHLAAIVSR